MAETYCFRAASAAAAAEEETASLCFLTLEAERKSELRFLSLEADMGASPHRHEHRAE